MAGAKRSAGSPAARGLLGGRSRLSIAAASPASDKRDGIEPVGELAELVEGVLDLALGRLEPRASAGATRWRASASANANAASRCWAPSCRSRSNSRRSASLAALTSARDRRRCASWRRSRACRRSWSSPSRTLRSISLAAPGVVEQPGPWQSSATRLAVADERRRCRARRRRALAAAGVDPAVGACIEKLELGVAEQARERVAQPPGRGGSASSTTSRASRARRRRAAARRSATPAATRSRAVAWAGHSAWSVASLKSRGASVQEPAATRARIAQPGAISGHVRRRRAPGARAVRHSASAMPAAMRGLRAANPNARSSRRSRAHRQG